MRIVLGVSGGIAAYKSAEIARSLIRNGHEVQVVMTRAAEEFIRPLTFASLTGRKVITDLFSSASPEATLSSSVEHIGVAQEHDLLLVAPATANLLAKFAHGIADDFLSTMYLAFRGPVVLAPAMNNNMWEHEATRANLETLRRRGHTIVDPDDGFLACGTYGPGRLAEESNIVAAVERQFAPGDLETETVLITAGPTQEPLDPVRYLSNRSSGKMGYALAQAAAERGARVILVSGPVSLNPPAGVEVIHVRTAAEMREAVFANLEPATVIIKCAAVADFRPSHESKQKIKKTSARISLELDPTADILAELGRKRGDRLLIGFAAETENLREETRRKLEAKNCDMVVGNLVGDSDTGFESDSNEVVLALRTGEFIPVERASKREIAGVILDQTLKLRRAAISA
ncbi:MAG TPA: bifunctional phosphopantothenoylcysteine decarboxylase/phosphopantothenate--cysteine ligase CoaBC [Bryobacteraceae bacterium]|jgi:phosphopantothenoylcysteine decarboxylase/phosphopantothenate--cysteine ligase|nr:bifunctional phosphopantothenoylcysteine decarboxylase/phosphopantothenate--cysteine ligase CoaBC [Bryobacteraceae bacterium]